MTKIMNSDEYRKLKTCWGRGPDSHLHWGAGVGAQCCYDVPPCRQGPGEPRDVFLKVASGPSPEVKDFFVTIYV